jgi:arsenate reductase
MSDTAIVRDEHKPRILFLCTGNSCRSQMAEGWLRALHGNRFAALSAGIVAHGMNPLAQQVMAEAGVDIAAQQSKTVLQLQQLQQMPDIVVAVCDHAAETCPAWPNDVRILRHSFDDPPALAKTASSEEEALQHYRRVRDEIQHFVLHIDQHLAQKN